ncbi:MAG: GDYXXLXY domain-containing protein, partial [Helicobacteraceae bacterium]|nr:GDYXXLXY domain-containing protein [Helicobacteraceae bacterium]
MREFLLLHRSKIVFAALGVMIAAQLFACVYQITKYESVVTFGKQIVLLTVSRDPFDAFRGRYVTLNIADGYIGTDKKPCKDYCSRSFFVTYKAELNERGLSEIDDVFLDEPNTELAYLKLEGSFDPYSKKVSVRYSFDRFYMQEDQAKAVDRDRGLLTGENEA